MKIKIDKNIPSPISGQKVDPNYPILDMEVGDSFFVPCKMTELAKIRGRINNCVNIHRNKMGVSVKFTTRVVDGGLRTWRLS